MCRNESYYGFKFKSLFYTVDIPLIELPSTLRPSFKNLGTFLPNSYMHFSYPSASRKWNQTKFGYYFII